jgi:hypothetical protein
LRLAGEPEAPFDVELVETADDRTRYARTLIVVATLDGPADAARTARRLLGRSRCDSVRARGAGWFEFADVYARSQRAVVLIATRRHAVDSLCAARAADVRHRIEASTLERCRDDLLSSPTAQLHFRDLAPSAGFDLRVPASYVPQPACRDWPNAVQFLRRAPTRMITVYWLDDVDGTRVHDAEFVTGLQRDVLWRLHGDTLAADATSVEATRWGRFDALRLEGIWQNRVEIGGGPLVTHFVHDPIRNRLYGIQCQLYAPGRSKRGWVRELLALASTFRIEGGE